MPQVSLRIPLGSPLDLFGKLKRDAALLLDDEVMSDRFFNFVITGYALIDWIKVERVLLMMDDRRLEIVARNRSLKETKEDDSASKLLNAYIRKAEEGELGCLLVEMVILQSAQTQSSGKAWQEAAAAYKADTNAIAAKVKQEFAVKEKAQAAKKAVAKAKLKPAKKAEAA